MKKLFVLLAIFAMTSLVASAYDPTSASSTNGNIYLNVYSPLVVSCTGNIELGKLVGNGQPKTIADQVKFTISGESAKDITVAFTGPILKTGTHLGEHDGGTVSLNGLWMMGSTVLTQTGGGLNLGSTGSIGLSFDCSTITAAVGARGHYDFDLAVSAYYTGF